MRSRSSSIRHNELRDLTASLLYIISTSLVHLQDHSFVVSNLHVQKRQIDAFDAEWVGLRRQI